MSILITGGTGYIGSHTALTLLEKGNKVVIIDNLSNSSRNSLNGIKKITGLEPTFYEGNISDKNLLKKIFSENSIDNVMHFAGLKSVADSVLLPLDYYENNISGTLCLLEEMKIAQVKNLIFSSSATVYGEPQKIPLTENCKTGGTTNPYGTSKLFLEKILNDIAIAYPDFRITILRYFNPVGAHPSGIIGEDPNGTPCNLMPYICQVAIGKYTHVSIFGSDYPTDDGTGVRDFIHVMDLAEGHVAALKYINDGPNLKIYNLGTGRGYSVLELLKTFERMTSISVPYVFTERRAGDIAECWSDPTKARVELGWVAKRKIDDMIKDAWNWQIKHLDSYETN